MIKSCLACLVNPILGCAFCDRMWCEECHASRGRKRLEDLDPNDRCSTKHEYWYPDRHFSASLIDCYKNRAMSAARACK